MGGKKTKKEKAFKGVETIPIEGADTYANGIKCRILKFDSKKGGIRAGVNIYVKNCTAEELSILNTIGASLFITNKSTIGLINPSGTHKISIEDSSVVKKIEYTLTVKSGKQTFPLLNEFNTIILKNKAKIYDFAPNFLLLDQIYSKISFIMEKSCQIFPWSEDIEEQKKGDQFELRRLYQLLKRKALEKHDNIQAWIFYAKELEAHGEAVKESGDWNDKIILWFNKWSNNFGLSWRLPLSWLVVWNLLFVGGYYFLNQGIVSYRLFFEMFNITTSPVLASSSDVIHSLDIVRRLVSGYLLYSFIIAMRRFSRKP